MPIVVFIFVFVLTMIFFILDNVSTSNHFQTNDLHILTVIFIDVPKHIDDDY